MRIVQRIQTKQGHPVPEAAYRARGPFPAEILEQPKVIYDYEPQDDSGGEASPIGGTAQNNFRQPTLFRCKECGTIVNEYELEEHDCNDYWDDDEDEDED
jgi:hypothetical protein